MYASIKQTKKTKSVVFFKEINSIPVFLEEALSLK